MRKRQLHQILAQITPALCGASHSDGFSLSKKGAGALIRGDGWQQKLSGALRITARCSCADVLKLCEPVLTRLYGAPREGWLSYVYRYALNILFPDPDFLSGREERGEAAQFFLDLLQAFLDAERQQLPHNPLLDLSLLQDDELLRCELSDEYRRFLGSFRREYVYETMRLSLEATPFKTLEHIAGVHHIAMTVARGLCAAGIPVDLSLVSGAAVGHDLGKYGCKPGERVPYLHYHYTERWFKERGLRSIGHIATNHSVWDLELENLTAESLILIYADFRVKQVADERQGEQIKIYTLDESFDVILSKLDNLDGRKLERYKFVYSKLRDFEDYMRSLGVDVKLEGRDSGRVPRRDTAFLTSRETVQTFKFMGIEHNIRLMHRLNSDRQFGNILEAARSEPNWKNIRAYLSVFEEYFTYLSPRKKMAALDFLYELLMHREGDIRRQAAALMGRIIARFQWGYPKERPAQAQSDPDAPTGLSMWKKYLDMIIRPDHKLTAQHKSWIGYTLKIVVVSLLEQCRPSEQGPYLQALLDHYANPADPTGAEAATAFVLLDAMLYIPLDRCNAQSRERLCEFAGASLRSDAPIELRVAALRFLCHLAETLPDEGPCRQRVLAATEAFSDEGSITLTYLKSRLWRAFGRDDCAQWQLLSRDECISDIFLDNLKTATPWIVKAVNISLLSDLLDRGRPDRLLHIAAHFSNLIKVSERVVVRHDAGTALLHIAPKLSIDQRNEIAVELAKGLEVGEYEFTKYIPEYLGAFALWLHPEELDELIGRLQTLMGSANDRIVSVALSTAGALLENYQVYRGRFGESDDQYRLRRERLLGMLMSGLAHFREGVSQESLLVIGKGLFGSDILNAHEKGRLFVLCHKKLLFLLGETSDSELTFYYRAAALNHIYRFIADRYLTRGAFKFERPDPVAFFPGTFDPFTLSHKGIVREIRRQGFEVYLAVDEFSWSKKTQPRLIRRQIVSMSVADEFGVHLFPDDFPVNLANNMDLRRLREAFPERSVSIVVGSDVIANASSYLSAPSPGSIHHFDHVVFRRASGPEETAAPLEDALSRIDGKVLTLSLPLHFEDISSTRIREYIDRNRDISGLISPIAQEYIYQNNLYLREPQYKAVLTARPILFETVDNPDTAQADDLCAAVLSGHTERETVRSALVSRGGRIVVLKNGEADTRPAGFAVMHKLGPADLLPALGQPALADFFRRRAGGRVLLISGLFCSPRAGVENPEQLLLTEVLSLALADDCTYALFYPFSDCADRIRAVLDRQGFLPVADNRGAAPLYAVDMHSPVVLLQNLETTIKEPFASDGRILATIGRAGRKLQSTMTRLYPGSLVLSLSTSVIHDRLVDKITALNGVPNTSTVPRHLGPYMCVPFGKILRGKVVPNTVTKTLHTDKVFDPDIKHNTIEAFPYYAPLASQIRTIRSFDRPVILIDDLLHAGDRLQVLDPLFKREDLSIRMVLVGLLSGLGRDLMTVQNHPADSVYYIPNLRHWFVESTLYPFIGGDTVRRDGLPASGLQPSINRILPYAAPELDRECSSKALFEWSLCCLQNARDILMALEERYRTLFGRNLTLSRLSEAVILPLCPDKGSCMAYDQNLAASVYLENDIEMLMRSRDLLCQ
jgi:nicotinic acid mononucleotide adenylyltransferase